MVKQLAELHGGTVAVASAEAQGARFVVWLPFRTSAHVDPAASSLGIAGGSAELLDRCALMVEDDDAAAHLVRLLLEAEGFRVIRAETAAEALVLAPQQRLSLITLDVDLRGRAGWELLARLRQSDGVSHVPVVLISSMIESNLELTSDADAILQKPVGRAELKGALSNLGLHEGGAHTRTVLVVDDDPKAVEVLAASLTSPAFAVVRAYGGSEAIALAQQLHPDLVLLDLMMPGIDGFEVIATLQRDVATANIPILVVTAKDLSEDDRKVLAGERRRPIRFVEKSGFDRRTFLAEVRRAVSAAPLREGTFHGARAGR
jgi:CheY-like chemotaxis protein